MRGGEKAASDWVERKGEKKTRQRTKQRCGNDRAHFRGRWTASDAIDERESLRGRVKGNVREEGGREGFVRRVKVERSNEDLEERETKNAISKDTDKHEGLKVDVLKIDDVST